MSAELETKTKKEQQADDALTEVIQAAKDVGLRIKSEMVDDSNPNIFQMDVDERNDTRRQVFRLHRGQATVRLVAKDTKHAQVVFQVQEPSQVFETWLENKKGLTAEELLPKVKNQNYAYMSWKETPEGGSTGTAWKKAVPTRYYGEKRTPGEKRWFLFGKDEGHYFIAQLPEQVESVKEAHDVLLPEAVRNLTPAQRRKVLRQGEFFFVPVTDGEVLNYVSQLLGNESTDTSSITRQNVTLDDQFDKTSSDEHEVEQMIANPDDYGQRCFVKGKVEHPRHTTLNLEQWHEVFINAEINDADGMGFVD